MAARSTSSMSLGRGFAKVEGSESDDSDLMTSCEGRDSEFACKYSWYLLVFNEINDSSSSMLPPEDMIGSF